ncbi:hypothetical protein BZA05DRAFT_438510 [Tricharina praecox]|uniref:uncharacterized protein n=1 Tax=Tricharina praecox TaxID=43433 RepID=UPI00221F4A7C|nr:uncharacterized protein BZA05DRAFT_438510 [Tricharina praecox]KAI5845456.1 hypothetical protein BZA05DRAFT_438510 [Tricharina praecox]
MTLNNEEWVKIRDGLAKKGFSRTAGACQQRLVREIELDREGRSLVSGSELLQKVKKLKYAVLARWEESTGRARGAEGWKVSGYFGEETAARYLHVSTESVGTASYSVRGSSGDKAIRCGYSGDETAGRYLYVATESVGAASYSIRGSPRDRIIRCWFQTAGQFLHVRPKSTVIWAPLPGIGTWSGMQNPVKGKAPAVNRPFHDGYKRQDRPSTSDRKPYEKPAPPSAANRSEAIIPPTVPPPALLAPLNLPSPRRGSQGSPADLEMWSAAQRRLLAGETAATHATRPSVHPRTIAKQPYRRLFHLRQLRRGDYLEKGVRWEGMEGKENTKEKAEEDKKQHVTEDKKEYTKEDTKGKAKEEAKVDKQKCRKQDKQEDVYNTYRR